MLLGPGALAAQQPTQPVTPPVVRPDTARRDTAKPDSITKKPVHRGVSPRGAFLRAMLVPGWGHSAIGAYTRGAFYFLAEGTIAWGLISTHERINEANRRLRFRQSVATADLAAQGITDPVQVQSVLDTASAVQEMRNLVKARKMQRQDWMALGIFVVFLSGADAYVSTHLQHFPAPISLEAQPAGRGRYDFSLSVKLPLPGLSAPSASGSVPRPPPARDRSGSAPSRRR